jgi:hypothetical protein
MEQTNQEEKDKHKRNFLKKVKEHAEKDIEILGTFVRLGVVVWSGFIITLNYVDIPMIKKGQSGGDITFVASVFTGALATFGLNTANNGRGKPEDDPKKKEP